MVGGLDESASLPPQRSSSQSFSCTCLINDRTSATSCSSAAPSASPPHTHTHDGPRRSGGRTVALQSLDGTSGKPPAVYEGLVWGSKEKDRSSMSEQGSMVALKKWSERSAKPGRIEALHCTIVIPSRHGCVCVCGFEGLLFASCLSVGGASSLIFIGEGWGRHGRCNRS